MLALTRKPFWDVELIRYVDAPIGEDRFAFGRMDCALWTAGAVDAMCIDSDVTGLARKVFGPEGSFDDMLASIPSVAELMVDWFGEPVPRPLCRRGDLLFDTTAHPTFAIMWGSRAYTVTTAGKLRATPVDALRRLFPQMRCFKIG